MSDVVKRLDALGVAVWLDDLNRGLVADGRLDRMVDELGLKGVTSNPTIFAKAMQPGGPYDDQLRGLSRRGVGAEEAARLLTAYDVRWACDRLRPVYRATNGEDGRVSIEVDPRLADDTAATVAEARALWWLVDRPNLFVKIPATRAGLPAVSEALAAGVSVNVTLIFSLDRYEEVLDAFLTGLERAVAAGHEPAGVASVASFFVSRVDSETDRRLAAVDTPEARELRGRAAVANARLAYERFEHMLGTERWQALAALGARPQRPLWASTGVKDPACPDTRYVDALAAPSTVCTMPEQTLRAVADHGRVDGNAIRGTYEEERRTLRDLARAGVSYQDVVETLEEDGVARFTASWNELLQTLDSALRSPR